MVKDKVIDELKETLLKLENLVEAGVKFTIGDFSILVRCLERLDKKIITCIDDRCLIVADKK